MLPERQISQQDDVLLRLMLEAAEAASSFSQGKTRADLDCHLLYLYGVAKAVELIGEAANYVSAISRAEFGGIDWDQIVGMRHRLVHDFHGIDLDRLWEAIRDDVPVLISQLQVALPQHDG